MAELKNDHQDTFSFSFSPSTGDSVSGASGRKKRRFNESTSDTAVRPFRFNRDIPSTDSNDESNLVPSNWSSFSFSDPVSPREQPFKFSFTDLEDAKQVESADDVSSPKEASSASLAMESAVAQDSKFAVTMKSKKSPRRIKLPLFQKIVEIEGKLNALDPEIKKQRIALKELLLEEMQLKVLRMKIEGEVASWTLNYRLWNSDDFVAWIFQIDHGYFKMKWQIKQRNDFDPDTFCEALNCAVFRFSTNDGPCTLFSGKHLEDFDVLDVQQLFPFLDRKDCRKLFSEIEELTEDGRSRRRTDLNCFICTRNRKTHALQCGHIYCKSCVDQISSCALCKKRVNKSSIIKVFL